MQFPDGNEIPAGLVHIFGKPDETEELSEAEAKVRLRGFKSLSDWFTVVMLTSIKHAIPGISLNDAKRIATLIGRQMANPGHEHRWRWAMGEIERYGMRGMLSRIKMELEHGQETRERL